jgi:hypothetical protein
LQLAAGRRVAERRDDRRRPTHSLSRSPSLSVSLETYYQVLMALEQLVPKGGFFARTRGLLRLLGSYMPSLASRPRQILLAPGPLDFEPVEVDREGEPAKERISAHRVRRGGRSGSGKRVMLLTVSASDGHPSSTLSRR